MNLVGRDAVNDDGPRIVEICPCAVATRDSGCDLEPTGVAARERGFATHSGSRRPIWMAEDLDAPDRGVTGYPGSYDFMKERPGYSIISDLVIYLHPDYQGKRRGTCPPGEAIRETPARGIEVLAATLFASNLAVSACSSARGSCAGGSCPGLRGRETSNAILCS